MADPARYDYPSPLVGYENAPPLSDEKAEDGKSECTCPSNSSAHLIDPRSPITVPSRYPSTRPFKAKLS